MSGIKITREKSEEREGVINPQPFLTSLIGKIVNVNLKWGQQYRGTLVHVDGYMNVDLEDVEEFYYGKKKSSLWKTVVRCNNIVLIHEFKEERRVRAAEAPVIEDLDDEDEIDREIYGE